MDVQVAGIVVLYNPDLSVKSNINSYLNYFDQLLLVDNSSDDNEFLFEDMLSNNVFYIALMENKGISYAINWGFTYFKGKDINYIITMDQDSYFETNIIGQYKDYIQRQEMGNVLALTPQYKTDRTNLSESTGYKEVKLTMQSGSLFSIDILDKIGPFNDELFLDVVDWEFFVRGWRRGMKIIRCNDAIIIHQPAITKEIRLGNKTIRYGTAAPVRYYYQIRNLLWGAIKYKYPYFLFMFIAKWVKIIFLFDNKREYIKYGIKAVKDAFHSNLGAYTGN